MLLKYFLWFLLLLSGVSPHAFAQENTDPEDFKNEGNELYNKGDIDGAIELWKKSIEADSTYSFAYNNIGVALYDKKDFQGSVEYLRKAVTLDTTYVKAFNSLGNAYLALEDYENAKTSFLKSIELDPEDEEKHNNLGNALLALGDFDGALKSYEKAIDINNNFARAYNNIGIIRQKRNDVSGANESFRMAIKVDSECIQAYINLGILYYGEDDEYLGKSIEYFEKAVSLDSENAFVLYNYSLALIKKGDYNNAVTHLTKATELSPDDPDIHYALGLAYAERKMKSLAVKSFEAALAIDPGYRNAQIALDYVNKNL